MANENASAAAIIGLLIGFLVVGVIGVYVGNSMIDAANLRGSVVGSANKANVTVGSANETIPTGVYSLDLTLVGSGGAGGAGNNVTRLGGSAGLAGERVTWTDIEVSPGQEFSYTIGAVGEGVADLAGTAGGATIAIINGLTYSVDGGAGGARGGSTNGTTGMPGTDGWNDGSGNGYATAGAAGTGGTPGLGGPRGYLRGAGGGGGGAGNVNGTGGAGGAGIVYVTAYDRTDSPMQTSKDSVVETFALGVTLCKILIIVSVASIVFMLLQRTGLIPRFGGGGEGGM